MKLQYSYNLLDAACALCNADYIAVADAIDAADKGAAEFAMSIATDGCSTCPDAKLCPQWEGKSADEHLELICPQGKRTLPSTNMVDYLPKEPRYIPKQNEAPAKVIEVSKYLQEALTDGALEGTPNKITRTSLVEFWSTRFPHDKPESLFPDEEVQVVDADLLLIIAALMEQLRVSGETQSDMSFNVNKLLGTGFGESKVEKIFALAKKTLKSRIANSPSKLDKYS